MKEYQGSDTDNKEISRMPFLMLGLDLPPTPLFKDVMEKNIIPQVYTPLALDFAVMAISKLANATLSFAKCISRMGNIIMNKICEVLC